MKIKYRFMLVLAAAVLAAGCTKSNGQLPVSGKKVDSVKASIMNTKGEEIGSAEIIEAEKGVTIHVQAEGIAPGIHGIHIHETGVCTPPDFKSAGGHFNPAGKEHGFDNPKGFHAGDLPNIEVGEDGKVAMKLSAKELSLDKSAPATLLDEDGFAIVIHEGPDDYVTDPAGNSGDRIACAAFKGN